MREPLFTLWPTATNNSFTFPPEGEGKSMVALSVSSVSSA